VAGWLGICYDNKDTSIVASILYGTGGGLIVDEVGLLLTMGNYWTGLTYAFLVVFLAFVFVLIFVFRYRAAISEELSEFSRSKIGLYFAVFLAAVSVAFIVQTDSLLVGAVAGAFAVVTAALILVFLLQNERKTRKNE
jgi:hypothetical protein